MALKQGMFSDQDVDDLLEGFSERRLHVPAYVRNVLEDIDLSEAVAPLNLFDCGNLEDGTKITVVVG